MGEAVERVLFVHAHPDDEAITTGGTIATLVEAGVAVTVLTCTRGELGEVIPEELVHLQGRGKELAEHRVGELAEAMRILGVTDHRYLGDADARRSGLEPRRYLDSGMVWEQDGPEPIPDPTADSLCAAPFGEVAADIATVIASLGPDAVVSYDERGGYGHPDHIRIHEATFRAAEVMCVPYFAIEPPDTASSGATIRVDVSAVIDRKTEAMRAHRTQVTVDGDRYALSSGPSLPIEVEESFRRIREDAAEDASFGQQGIGAKVATSVIALVAGAGLGVLATINHQATMTVFDTPLPIGVVAALLITSTLFVGLRLVFDHRAPTAFAALGMLAVLWLLAQAGPGGSVLVPANPVGYAWTFGPPLLAALVLAWPRLPQRTTG